MNDDVSFTVEDEESFKANDLVGSGSIKISQLIINGGINDWITIYHDNKPSGKVLIRTTHE